MSEVLSRRIRIFPADERQSLRLGRFLFAFLDPSLTRSRVIALG